MRNLNTLFPDAKSYATQANAQKKLDALAGALGENTLTTTTQRPDGRWIAVVIYTDREALNIPFLCQHGVCIVN